MLEHSAARSPSIESVSDDGQVRVRLADGRTTVLQIPIEQVDQLRRAAFIEYRARTRTHWLSDAY